MTTYKVTIHEDLTREQQRQIEADIERDLQLGGRVIVECSGEEPTNEPAPASYGEIDIEKNLNTQKAINENMSETLEKEDEYPKALTMSFKIDDPKVAKAMRKAQKSTEKKMKKILNQDLFGGKKKKSKRMGKKLDAEAVREIRASRKVGSKIKDIAKSYGVSTGTIDQIVHRHTWKHVK